MALLLGGMMYFRMTALVARRCATAPATAAPGITWGAEGGAGESVHAHFLPQLH